MDLSQDCVKSEQQLFLEGWFSELEHLRDIEEQLHPQQQSILWTMVLLFKAGGLSHSNRNEMKHLTIPRSGGPPVLKHDSSASRPCLYRPSLLQH